MSKSFNRSKKNRPKHLNLLQIRFPVTAILSVGHRASGILLFLLTPLFIFFMDLSLSSPEGFAEVKSLFATGAVKLALFIVIWAGLHHLFAGIRFLILDLGLGEEKAVARKSAWTVIVSAIASTLISAWLWL